MTLEWITTDLSENAPAGPDLWETDDSVFNEYYFDAAARLPEADDYAKIGLAVGDGAKMPDTIFDPKTVSFRKEAAQIDGLLRRSRDLRLLTLRAQWAALAGEIDEAAASVTAMADVLEEMPVAVHPVINESPRDRLEAINDLCAVGAMILPLRYLDIGGTGASLRRMMVADGKMTPHDGEHDLSIDAMNGAMSKSPESVTQTYSSLTAFRKALTRIEIACLSNETPHTPQLKKVREEIDAVLAVILEAKPDLDTAPEDAGSVGVNPTDETAGIDNGAAVGAPATTEVKSHDEARRRLTGVETYFGTYEPSSAAVLLVTQSRLLIGKSLVDAFDILMPESAGRAAVDFISDSGFKLAHQQLRELANQVLVEVRTSPDELDKASQPRSAHVSQSMSENTPAQATDGSDSGASRESDEMQEGQPVSDPTNQDEPENTPVAHEGAGPKMPLATRQSFHVTDAGMAASQILAVETYFRAREKSSPIPMLLTRARSYIGKDFETLLKEFVPKIDY